MSPNKKSIEEVTSRIASAFRLLTPLKANESTTWEDIELVIEDLLAAKRVLDRELDRYYDEHQQLV